MNDKVEILKNGTLIQHGKHNNRIYLMKLNPKDCPHIITTLNNLANNNQYTKIFCKVPSWAAPLFIADGYLPEAFIPKFYNKKEDLLFLSKFISSDRFIDLETEKLKELHQLLHKKPKQTKFKKKKPLKFKVKKLDDTDVDQITGIYREVFLSYPFPIHNPGYIHKTMKENVQYFGAKNDNKLIAVSSAEVDEKGLNAEMTDFATKPEFTGNNLSVNLLNLMEKEMKKQGIKTLYTIARLNSTAMNKTFLRLNYKWSGTLIKNTNIAGNIESMNVYYKHI